MESPSDQRSSHVIGERDCYLSIPTKNHGYSATDSLHKLAETNLADMLKPNIQARQDTDWKPDDAFEYWYQWTENEKNIVRTALVGIMDLATTTIRTISATLPSMDPSFTRYFRDEDLNAFGAVLQRVMAILGVPIYSGVRNCIFAGKLILLKGDGPDTDLTKPKQTICSDTARMVVAYQSSFFDNYGIVRHFISLCPVFFDKAKLHTQISTNPNIPYVNPAKFQSYIDDADAFRLPEVESSASILLHEMLHWTDLAAPAAGGDIIDVKITRPDNKKEIKAYRSYYSSKVKDASWGSAELPLLNADCYVYTILEIYYRVKYDRKPWSDSPDPEAPVASGGSLVRRQNHVYESFNHTYEFA